MSNLLRVTFTGGADLLGETREADLESPILVGRSHAAAIRFTAKDRDVSGHHVEIRREGGSVCVEALKAFTLNDRDRVLSGEKRTLAVGDILTLGPNSRAGLRIDALPEGTGPSTATPADATGVTRFSLATGVTEVAQTDATDFLKTEMTQFLSEPPAAKSAEFEVAPPAAEERPTGGGAPVQAEAREEGETEVLDPAKLKEEWAATDAPTHQSDFPALFEEEPPTGAPPPLAADNPSSGVQTTGSGAGLTKPLLERETTFLDPRKISNIDPDAPRRLRKRLMVFSIAGFAAMVGVGIYATMNHSARWLSHPNMVITHFENASGEREIDVDYPWHAHATRTETPTSLQVTTLTGKDRDCPFNLDFSIRTEPDQLNYSLEEAVQREVENLGRQGYVFAPSDEDGSVSPEERAGFFFYEDQYPLQCGARLPHGTRFFRREYTVARDGQNWWGLYFFLRSGDKVYRLFRDIPERQKVRGRYLLLKNPDFALHGTFLRAHWESEGRSAFPKETNVEKLLIETAKLLDGGWAQDWAIVSKNLNALMILTYGRKEATAEAVREMWTRFRKCQDDLWRDLENQRDEALRNGNQKVLRDVCQKCRGAFGQDKTDWRFKRSNDAREWPWEIKTR